MLTQCPPLIQAWAEEAASVCGKFIGAEEMTGEKVFDSQSHTHCCVPPAKVLGSMDTFAEIRGRVHAL